ncbi:MAG: acyl-CoA acyltransferase [Sulfurimonas sp.]
MSIKIRNANVKDAPFLAKMILQSSRAGKKDGMFDIAFEMNDDKKILEKLEMLVQTQAKNYTHFSNFLVAEMDGRSVGSLCSYEPRIATKEQFIVALREVGCSDEANERLDAYYSCEFNLNNRTLMFDFMEEEADSVDVGVLKALMQKSLLSARLKGYRIAQTIIEIGSLEAELFYKKLGLHVVEQKECEQYKEKFGRAGLMLMAIEF